MSEGKKVSSNDENLEVKGTAKELDSKDEFKEAIEVGTTIEEQDLYKESNSEALAIQRNTVINSPEAIQIEKMKLFAQQVIKSGVSGIKKEADAIVILMRGAELGLSYAVSINNIFAINGKTGMSVHLHKAMLQNAGIYFDLEEDKVPVYAYGIMKEKPEGGAKTFIPMGTTTNRKVEGFSVSPKVIDYQTTYYFEREVKMPLSGQIRIKKVRMSYLYSEAVEAQLVEKDVWVKYSRSLMKARAFTSGASEIASDVIQGMYGINELAMLTDRKFTINDNLEEKLIDTDYQDADEE
jgi:hypothetical protein